jgi:ABC-type multidrug transport system ATPase subunit
MARIKGITTEQADKSLELIIRTMGLMEFITIQAKNLSGGNKRKLSCAMTLMLSP